MPKWAITKWILTKINGFKDWVIMNEGLRNGKGLMDPGILNK